MNDERRKGFLDSTGRVMKILAAVCLMAMPLVTGADVVGRGTMNAPIFGSEEIVAILAVLVVGFSLPYTHTQGSHIGVEVLVRHFSRKARAVLKCVVNLTASILFFIVAWRMVLYGLSQREAGVVSMNLALPTYYVLFVLGFCFLVFGLYLLRDSARSFKGIRG